MVGASELEVDVWADAARDEFLLRWGCGVVDGVRGGLEVLRKRGAEGPSCACCSTVW